MEEAEQRFPPRLRHTRRGARTSGGNDTFDAAAALEGFRARRGLTSFCPAGAAGRGGENRPPSIRAKPKSTMKVRMRTSSLPLRPDIFIRKRCHDISNA